MNYISNTREEREKMLQTIGVSSLDELFSAIPKEVKLDRPLDLPGGLAEAELKREARRLAEKNLSLDDFISFLGGGAYDHLIPSIIDHLISRSEYYTAYTPYQAELSQGTLQAIYEYQSMICELTGMDAANASLLDGGSATAEAILMAGRVSRKKKVLISQGVHPSYRQVSRTYGEPRDLEFTELRLEGTETDLKELEEKLDEKTAAVVIQYPNFFGSVEDMQKIGELVSRQKKAMFIIVADPLALSILKSPADLGADIVVGEGQPLGNNISYGGPYLGYMATRKKYIRQFPGRIAGATEDVEGNRGYVLTLQTREQHIRREKATSNICSNEALNALIATIYLAVLGKEGIREVASQSLKKAHYLADRIEKMAGFSIVNKGDFFHEFLVKTPVPAARIIEKMRQQGILPGLDIARFDYDFPGLLVCVTEKRTRDELDLFLANLEVFANG